MKQQPGIDTQFIQMIHENTGIIYKVASFYSNPEYPLEDLYQEIVLNLWRSFPTFRAESKLSTWMYRIALNTCISFYRKKQVNISYVNIPIEVPDDSEANDDILELYKLINKLSEIEKALVLLYLENKSYKEIAEITGLTQTNVATRLNRAKQKMKEMSEPK